LKKLNKYSNSQDILRIGFPEGPTSHCIQITSSEIEALERQYLLAYIIKKTEKIYKEIKEKAIRKRK